MDYGGYCIVWSQIIDIQHKRWLNKHQILAGDDFGQTSILDNTTDQTRTLLEVFARYFFIYFNSV